MLTPSSTSTPTSAWPPRTALLMMPSTNSSTPYPNWRLPWCTPTRLTTWFLAVLGEALEADALIAEDAGAECVDTGEARRCRAAVDVAGRQAVGEQPGHGFVEVTGGQGNGVPIGRIDLQRQLGGGHPGQAGRAQAGILGVQRQARLLLYRQQVTRHQHGVGGVVTGEAGRAGCRGTELL